MQVLRDVELFLIDMDGTFYLGEKLLPGAQEFLALCQSRNIPFMFLTNNSSKSPKAYLQKLAGLGVRVSKVEMFTSGEATLLYMKKNGFPKDILLVGTQSLEEQFCAQGYNVNSRQPEAVVLGFDTGITYQKLSDLCDAVRSGMPYIATHPDLNCPVQGGYIPDIGAVIAFVEAATKRVPDVVVGKPNAVIAQMAADKHHLPLEKLCMVGDRLYTDIAMGRCGVKTVLVLSGEASAKDAEQSEFKADWTFDNLAGLAAALQKETAQAFDG